MIKAFALALTIGSLSAAGGGQVRGPIVPEDAWDSLLELVSEEGDKEPATATTNVSYSLKLDRGLTFSSIHVVLGPLAAGKRMVDSVMLTHRVRTESPGSIFSSEQWLLRMARNGQVMEATRVRNSGVQGTPDQRVVMNLDDSGIKKVLVEIVKFWESY